MASTQLRGFLCVFAVLLVKVYSHNFHLNVQFKTWMIEHGKTYQSFEEYLYRRGIFADTHALVEKHNAGNHSFTLGHNQFSDMDFEEFQSLYLMSSPQDCSAAKYPSEDFHVDAHMIQMPRAVDWRKKGVVSPVKNQGSCGSCWAFSTTGAMEAHVTLATGKKLLLSEQQLVDCAQDFNNHGCSGGLPSQAFEYIHYNHGLETEEDYPYNAKESAKCSFSESLAAAFVYDIFNITERDELQLERKVAHAGPVSIAYQVASDFKQYKSGIYDSKICKDGPQDINHAVLAVGYDVDDSGKEYWIVKNSWGTSFGMDGYFNIARGKNMCGLSDCASYPIIRS